MNGMASNRPRARRFGPTRIQRCQPASRRVRPADATCRVRHDSPRHVRAAATRILHARHPTPHGHVRPPPLQTAAPNRRHISNTASRACQRRAAEPPHAATTDSPRPPRIRATGIFRRGVLNFAVHAMIEAAPPTFSEVDQPVKFRFSRLVFAHIFSVWGRFPKRRSGAKPPLASSKFALNRDSAKISDFRGGLAPTQDLGRQSSKHRGGSPKEVPRHQTTLKS